MYVDKQYLIKFLTAVRDGEMVTVVDSHNTKEWLVSVKNPSYREDIENDQYLVLSVAKELK